MIVNKIKKVKLKRKKIIYNQVFKNVIIKYLK